MTGTEETRSVGSLLGDLGRQVSTLVRKEIELARIEVVSGVSRLGRGAAMAGVGGALVYAGLLALIGAAILGLIESGMDAWAAALVVGLVVLVVGALITWSGAGQIRTARLAPTQTAETVRENADFVKEQLQ